MKEYKLDITYQEILKNKEIATYISKADVSLESMGYTDHSFNHVKKCADTVKNILEKLNYSNREIELGQIAAYMHDIGNVINRHNHAQSGALMAFNLLSNLNLNCNDISTIITAIGNHDDESGYPIDATSAALIIADKTDVRRSRVRPYEIDSLNDDIHDRVNYAVEESDLEIDDINRIITLHIKLDTKIASVIDYFEIFSVRMSLCKKAASKLKMTFKLNINGDNLKCD